MLSKEKSHNLNEYSMQISFKSQSEIKLTQKNKNQGNCQQAYSIRNVKGSSVGRRI